MIGELELIAEVNCRFKVHGGIQSRSETLLGNLGDIGCIQMEVLNREQQLLFYHRTNTTNPHRIL